MKETKQENTWLNLGFNILVPTILLIKGDDWFGSALGILPLASSTSIFILALLFPVAYGIYDLIRRRKWNFFSILGTIGVLLTGGIGLLKLPTEWIAIKEAAIPGILGLAILISTFTRKPLVRVFLYRPEIFQVDKIKSALDERDAVSGFERLMRQTTYLLAASFFLSAVLNYILARRIVVSPSGTEAFNQELGKLMAWSYPVIVAPTLLVTIVALWVCFSGLRKLTGLTLEELIVEPEKKS